MEAVCRERHSAFVKAVAEMPAHERGWFVGHVLNPDGCLVLALPEAE
jgi:hypothetical protein